MLDSPRSSVDSYGDLTANQDGGVQIQFSSDPPAENDANWVYVAPGRPSLVVFRFYGPEPAVRDGSWILPDLEKLSSSAASRSGRNLGWECSLDGLEVGKSPGAVEGRILGSVDPEVDEPAAAGNGADPAPLGT